MPSKLDERCGIVYESGDVKELVNSHPDPQNNFMIMEEHLLEPGVVGTFHTHPLTGPNLSVADYYAFMAYPTLRHYIISAGKIWCFQATDGILLRYENPNLPRFPADLMP